MKKLSTEQCIARLQNLYGNKYNYSKVQYINSRSNITLICPIHGEFNVYANSALNGKIVCPVCSRTSNLSSYEYFIQKAKEVHQNKYDYSKVQYKGPKTPIIIICPIHGEFKQTPQAHIHNKFACKQCYKEFKQKSKNLTIKLSEEDKAIIRRNQWVKECTSRHSNKYDYSLITSIKNLKDKVPIICPIHGLFYQEASSHKKHGCQQCSRKFVGNKIKLTLEEFKRRAIKKHGNKYIYNEYTSMHEYINIRCPEHGIFQMTPSNHLKGYGCPVCASSKGELFINQYLSELNIQFETQYAIKLKCAARATDLALIDFKLEIENKIIFIEYNGIQHYKYIPYFHKNNIDVYKQQLYRDELVRQYCLENNIKLLEIPYTMSTDMIKLTIKNIIYEN